MEYELTAILIIILVFFIAGFIDSIAGGGGIITIPALLFIGLPPQSVLGTSKFASTFGTAISVYNFAKSKKIIWKVIGFGIIFSFIGSFLGSKTVLLINPATLAKIIIFMLPLGIISVIIPKKKDSDNNKKLSKKDKYLKIPIICLIIGFYDGFFGPGTGSFLTVMLYLFLKMELINATANSKVFNLISNIGGLTVFLISSKVVFILAIPSAIASIAGNFIGSRLAIKKGDKILKPFLIIVLISILISLIL